MAYILRVSSLDNTIIAGVECEVTKGQMVFQGVKNMLYFVLAAWLLCAFASCMHQEEEHLENTVYELFKGRLNWLCAKSQYTVPGTLYDYLTVTGTANDFRYSVITDFVTDKESLNQFRVELSIFFKDIYLTFLEDTTKKYQWGCMGEDFWKMFVISLCLERGNFQLISSGESLIDYSCIPAQHGYIGDWIVYHMDDFSETVQAPAGFSMNEYEPVCPVLVHDIAMRLRIQDYLEGTEKKLGEFVLWSVVTLNTDYQIILEEITRNVLEQLYHELDDPTQLIQAIGRYFLPIAMDLARNALPYEWLLENFLFLKKISFCCAFYYEKVMLDPSPFDALFDELIRMDWSKFDRKRERRAAHDVFKLFYDDYE